MGSFQAMLLILFYKVASFLRFLITAIFQPFFQLVHLFCDLPDIALSPHLRPSAVLLLYEHLFSLAHGFSKVKRNL